MIVDVIGRGDLFLEIDTLICPVTLDRALTKVSQC